MNDVPIGWQLLLQVALIALNAIFACAEIAVISINDNRIAKLAAQGDKRAVRLAKLTSQPATFLSTIQVAITLSGFLGSAFAADNFANRLSAWLVELGVGIPVTTLNTISLIVITLILSYFTLVFGELVPKRVAMKRAEKLALGMSGFIGGMANLFRPVVWLLTISTNALLRLLKIDPNEDDDEVTEEEIRMMVDAGSEKGTIDHSEKEWIQNVFEFDDITADEIATHRTELSVLWVSDSVEEWDKTIKESRRSILPICDESVDNIIGVLNTKDYFRLCDLTKESILTNAVAPAFFVPESIRADVLFHRMKQSRNHFAIILDEYGGVTGIVTMNDLLEQLVGDLDDDTSQPPEVEIQHLSADKWKILGSAELDDVQEALGVSLPLEEYDTFGGFVMGTYSSIPDDGTEIDLAYENLAIHVTEIKDHRVEVTYVTVTPKEYPENSGDEKEE